MENGETEAVSLLRNLRGPDRKSELKHEHSLGITEHPPTHVLHLDFLILFKSVRRNQSCIHSLKNPVMGNRNDSYCTESGLSCLFDSFSKTS